MDPTTSALHLQGKVQFDRRLYFCCRGSENMDKMIKDDFALKFNAQTER